MGQTLMKGNEAVVLGAILGGSSHYFGYPITPASEIAHTAALCYPACGREFLQAECELASINMIYGAAAAGARAMTGTSSPGLSLMAEGLSYIAAAELPCLVVDVQRTGPGLGNIWPEQSDYNCTVKGGGHGNYKVIVLAPNSAQEMCDFAYEAFEMADKWRIPVIMLSDAYIGQMMEPVQLPEKVKQNPRKDWAIYGDRSSRGSLITSIFMNPQVMSERNEMLQAKYQQIEKSEILFEEYLTDDADDVFIAFGICSRLCRTAVQMLRQRGCRAGLLRPKTLWPFPSAKVTELGGRARRLVTVELNNGQMFEDVRLAAPCRDKLRFYRWMGGIVPSAEEIVDRLLKDREQPCR